MNSENGGHRGSIYGCCRKCISLQQTRLCQHAACGFGVSEKCESLPVVKGAANFPFQSIFNLPERGVGEMAPPQSALQSVAADSVSGARQLFVESVKVASVPPAVPDGHPFTAKAGTTLGSGSLGCSLRSADSKIPYFLTAGHVVEPFQGDGAVPRLHGRELGTVVAWSTNQSSRPHLDWGLVKASDGIRASNALNWDPGKTLHNPIAFEDLRYLLDHKIALSGAAGRKRQTGTVVLVYACAFVMVRSGNTYECRVVRHQIIVEDRSLKFGQDGDSGAVAYLPAPLDAGERQYPAGTAVGLFWIKNLSQDLYVLTPLCNVLDDVRRRHPRLHLALWHHDERAGQESILPSTEAAGSSNQAHAGYADETAGGPASDIASIRGGAPVRQRRSRGGPPA